MHVPCQFQLWAHAGVSPSLTIAVTGVRRPEVLGRVVRWKPRGVIFQRRVFFNYHPPCTKPLRWIGSRLPTADLNARGLRQAGKRRHAATEGIPTPLEDARGRQRPAERQNRRLTVVSLRFLWASKTAFGRLGEPGSPSPLWRPGSALALKWADGFRSDVALPSSHADLRGVPASRSWCRDRRCLAHRAGPSGPAAKGKVANPWPPPRDGNPGSQPSYRLPIAIANRMPRAHRFPTSRNPLSASACTPRRPRSRVGKLQTHG